MSSLHDADVEARLARLEAMVAEIHRRLPPLPESSRPRVDEADPSRPRASVTAGAGFARRADAPRGDGGGIVRLPAWDGQTWLNRLGIVLLLLGVGLLFRYSIDQGWLTPAVRVGFGAFVGTVLLGIGVRMDRGRRFSSVLLGGGLAAYYLTGWAAFHLYGLVGYAFAFGAMVVITLVAFGLAMRRGEPALAILGAAGGLGTPLLLGISYATPRGLAAYTSFVLAWTVVPYLRRGWRPVLWTSLAGAWLLLPSYAEIHARGDAPPAPGMAWLQAAIAFAWIVTGVLPVLRRLRAASASSADAPEPRWRDADFAHWYGLAIVPPAMAVVATALAWNLSQARWGALLVAAAAVYAGAAAMLRRTDLRLARVLVVGAAVLLPAGCLGALDGDALLLALAAQALALHGLGARGGGAAVRWMAHRLWIGIGAWVLWRLAATAGGDSLHAAADLLAVAGAFASSRLLRARRYVVAYRLLAHAALLGWLWRELAPLEGGQGIATVAWGAYALGLLLLAMRRGWPLLERVAVYTLLATVAKLFVVDLARLDALFRVLLFLGFGAVFLYLSYSLSARWRARPAPEPGPRPAAPLDA